MENLKEELRKLIDEHEIDLDNDTIHKILEFIQENKRDSIF